MLDAEDKTQQRPSTVDFPRHKDDGPSTRDERLLIMAAYRGLTVMARAHVQSIMHASRAAALRGRVWLDDGR